MKSQVIFADDKLKKEFEELKKFREKKLYEQLVKVFKNLEENPF